MNSDALTEVQPLQDDEKTVREERIENAIWSEKKDSEDGERTGSETTAVVQSDDRERQGNPEDDFPDGGFQAWLVALGVSVKRTCRRITRP